MLPLGNLTWNLDQAVVLHVHLPRGSEVVYVKVDSGPLTDLAFFFNVACFAYFVWVIMRYFRAGNRGSLPPSSR